MPGGITTKSLQAAIARLNETFEACADELNRLDGELGDGDLGVTMMRGCRALAEASPELPDDVGMALLKCAQAFVKISGSTFGTILATGLMSAAKKSKGLTEVTWAEISPLLAGALEAIMRRSKGELGDKTVLDAIEAVRKATEGLEDPAQIHDTACRAVDDALDQFRPLPARQGRARIFGEKSKGRDDPGMVVFKRIVDGLR